MVEGIFKYMANIRHSALALAAAAALTGCGDTGANEPWDPLEGANRFVFSINRAVDTIAMRPVAVFYRDWMPAPGQRGVHNVVENLGEPVTAINEVVQGDSGPRRHHGGRFMINSTIGVAGIFDVASKIGLSKTKEGIGDTIGYYAGVEPENGGFYMVLPVIGPSNARDGVGLAIDAAVDPFSIITFGISNTAGWIYSGTRYGATAGRMPVPNALRAGRPREEFGRLLCRPEECIHPAASGLHPAEAGQDRAAGGAGAARQGRAGALGFSTPSLLSGAIR